MGHPVKVLKIVEKQIFFLIITFVSAFLGPSLSLRYLLSMTPAFSRARRTASTSALQGEPFGYFQLFVYFQPFVYFSQISYFEASNTESPQSKDVWNKI